MKRNIFISNLTLLLAVMLLFLPAACLAEQDKGKEILELPGGEKWGTVIFKHHAHQERVPDCQTCHKKFDQKEGAIAAAIKSGDLRKKQIMDKTCRDCHKANKKAGKKTGPTNKCSACHTK